MAIQTSYSRYFKSRLPGWESDTGRSYKREATNKSGSDLDVGIGVIQYSGLDSGVNAISAVGQPLVGIILNDFGRNPNGLTTGAFKSLAMAPMLCEGAINVQCDQVCQPGDPVFVRIAASGSGKLGIVGSFRKDADGVAQVSTVTPTAANATIYVLRVEFPNAGGETNAGTVPDVYEFEFLSDGSATATKVVTGFKTVMAADAAFSARVVASGTATLVLTGQVAGESFTVAPEGDGVMSVAPTTPPAATARKVKGARWLSTSVIGLSTTDAAGSTSGGTGEIYFSAAAESP
jgi:hypothetical protein